MKTNFKKYDESFDNFAKSMAQYTVGLSDSEQEEAIENFNELFSLGFYYTDEDEENGLIIFK